MCVCVYKLKNKPSIFNSTGFIIKTESSRISSLVCINYRVKNINKTNPENIRMMRNLFESQVKVQIQADVRSWWPPRIQQSIKPTWRKTLKKGWKLKKPNYLRKSDGARLSKDDDDVVAASGRLRRTSKKFKCQSWWASIRSWAMGFYSNPGILLIFLTRGFIIF